MDCNWVTSRLAVGGAVGNDAAEMVAAGITDVVDCQAETDDHLIFATLPQVAVLWIGVNDDGQPKPVEWFQQGIEFAFGALLHPHRRLLVHCAAGVNRGPSMAYAILRAWGFPGDTAMAMLKAVRPQVAVAYRGYADEAITALGY